jgi:hypothetical protein
MTTPIEETLENLRLKRLASKAQIVISKFNGHENHFFGISNRNELIILFTTNEASAVDLKIVEFPRYEHMQVQLDQKLSVEYGNSVAIERIFHVLSFRSDDKNIQIYFLQYIEGVVNKMGDYIQFQDLVPLLATALSLFRLVSSPPKTELQGLWAELCMIAESSNPEDMANEWHVTNSTLWDFQSKDRIVEVKSTTSGQRIHEFKNDQLLMPKNVETSVIASFILTRTDDGESIWDLLKEINRKVSPKASEKVYKLVHELLGNRIAQSESIRFDRRMAKSQLLFYAIDSVPAFDRTSIPLEISDVRFKVNFTGIPELSGFSL